MCGACEPIVSLPSTHQLETFFRIWLLWVWNFIFFCSFECKWILMQMFWPTHGAGHREVHDLIFWSVWMDWFTYWCLFPPDLCQIRERHIARMAQRWPYMEPRHRCHQAQGLHMMKYDLASLGISCHINWCIVELTTFFLGIVVVYPNCNVG